MASVSASALRDAVGDSPARAFYSANGWQAAWSEAAGQALSDALRERSRHALDRVEFPSPSGNSPAEREAALTRAALAYAGAIASGLTDPADLYDLYTIPRPEPDIAVGLAQALKSGRLTQWIDGLAPQTDEYRAISQVYLRLRESAVAQGEAVPEGALIRPGERDPRVPRIAAILARDGHLSGPAPDGTLYTARLKQAVERLQVERGIKKDGVVGPDTLQALNRGAADRARAAAVALERRRWLTRDPAPVRIDVNTASARLTYFRDGRAVDTRKVIVGQPGWKTPQLQSAFYRLVANPTWTVPRSIQQRELGNLGPSALRSRNMVWRDGWIVQLSGPENALGLVKFDMINEYAIYLHDTPAKPLFERTLRQLSHGCVRVNDALGFASMIAADQGITAKWQEARATGEQTFVPLADHIPVRLLYHPTHLGPSGEVRFQQDVYGWNAPVSERLGFGPRKGARPDVPEPADLGP